MTEHRPALLLRVSAVILQFANRLAGYRAEVWCVVLLGVVVLLAAINRTVLLGFPNSGDEYAYLYQASTFAAGRVWNAAPSSPEIFELSYIVYEDGRAFSSFPLGWPLLLSGAMKVGVPVWLVNPLLGAVTLWLVARLGARLYDARTGVLSAVIVGASPFFLFNAASFFSHTFCGALLLAAASLAARDDRSPAWVSLSVGFLIGWSVLTRYLTGVVCGIPIALWLLRPDAHEPTTAGSQWSWQRLTLVCAGALPCLAALAWYNRILTGDLLELTTTDGTLSLWFRSGWWLRGADILSTHLLRHALWTPLMLVPLYVLYLRTSPRDMRRGLFEWMPVIIAAAMYGFVQRGGNQYGPRFHYEVFLFLTIFVTANAFREPARTGPFWPQWRMAALGVSVAAMPLVSAAHAVIERRVIVERMDPYASVAEAGLQNALVLIGGRVGSTRSMAAVDLTRNGIDQSGSVLYGLDIGPIGDCVAHGQYPTRSTYLYSWDGGQAKGVLSSLQCP